MWKIGFRFLDIIMNLIFPGLSGIFALFNNTFSLASLGPYITTFRSWLGVLFYFFPFSFLKPFIITTLLLWIARIVMSIFRIITDLL